MPPPLFAGIYKYETAEGEILITTQPRADLRLIEIISGDPPSSSSAKKSDKKTKNLDRAQTAKLKHVARHGAPEDVRQMAREDREAAFDDIIEEASAAYDVPFGFIKAVIRVESNFNPIAMSAVGAQGLMQLMPRTAASLNVRDPFDPRQNIFGGTKLLRLLIDRYDGDINLILSAYNAGDVAVNRYEGIPYPKTRLYVSSVYRYYKLYSAP